MKRIPLEGFLEKVQERVSRFRHTPGVRLPLYESHGSVDFGRFLCLVRADDVWRQADPTPDGEDQETQALLAEHLACSVQDVEELLHVCHRLRLENKLLKGWLNRRFDGCVSQDAG